MKMWKWRFIQRMSGRRRRSIRSPGNPGMGTNRPPPTALQRWVPTFVVRILPAAEGAPTTAITAIRSGRSRATHLDTCCRVPAIDLVNRHEAADPEPPRLDWRSDTGGAGATARLARVTPRTSLYRRHRPQSFDEVV